MTESTSIISISSTIALTKKEVTLENDYISNKKCQDDLVRLLDEIN